MGYDLEPENVFLQGLGAEFTQKELIGSDIKVFSAHFCQNFKVTI